VQPLLVESLLVRLVAWSEARSEARLVARSVVRSLARLVAKLVARLVARSVDRLVVRSVVRSVVNFNSYADLVHFEKKKNTIRRNGILMDLAELLHPRTLVGAYPLAFTVASCCIARNEGITFQMSALKCGSIDESIISLVLYQDSSVFVGTMTYQHLLDAHYS
jgi:hypothetical protein